MSHNPFLHAAIAAARAGEEIITRYYQHQIEIKLKPDQTPLTIADIETERAIKDVLKEAFPTHGFYGEETGADNLDAEHLWLVDPIDGTKSFVRQYPFFSTQIALMENGRIILGVSNGPVFTELAYAEAGGGSYPHGSRLSISGSVS